MSYDTLGNIVQKGSSSYGYGQASGINANEPIHAVTHLSGSHKYIYDDNGNMTVRYVGNKRWDMTWTPDNMLETAVDDLGNSVGMKYDADGQLVLRVENRGNEEDGYS